MCIHAAPAAATTAITTTAAAAATITGMDQGGRRGQEGGLLAEENFE